MKAKSLWLNMNDPVPPSTPAPRVLHILNELCMSGAEIMLASAARQLGAQDSTIVSTGERPGNFAVRLHAAGYEIQHLPFARTVAHFTAMRRIIRRGAFDVVHVHCERARFWYILLGRALGKPVVTTLHAEFPFSGALRRRKMIGRRLAARMGARFVACSRRVARNEKARFGITPQVVLNWADPARVSSTPASSTIDLRCDLGIPSDAFMTISIANETPVKNLEGLARALAQTAPGHLHFHVGAITPAFAKEAGMLSAGRMRFAGQVEDIGPYLAASDGFVCSSFAEGGPLVLIEAAMAALPCVTTDVGIVEEFAGLAGVHVVTPDPSAIAQGIEALRALPAAVRREQGEALARIALARHGPETAGNHYAALYRSMVPARGAQVPVP